MSTLVDRRGLFWTAAAALALTGHVAICAVLIAAPVVDEDTAPAGAMVVELAPISTSMQTPMQPLPAGPASADSAEGAPAKASLEDVREQVEAAVPVEKAPVEPEVALPEPTPIKSMPTEEKPTEVATRQQQESAASLASAASAPPKIDASAGETTVAPSIGINPASKRVRANWHRSISMHLERFKRYPGESPAGGSVIVEFEVSRDGTVTSKKVLVSSSEARLDAAALKLLERASPLPVPPKDLAGDGFVLRVPIIYTRP